MGRLFVAARARQGTVEGEFIRVLVPADFNRTQAYLRGFTARNYHHFLPIPLPEILTAKNKFQ
jgi:hypothetical protein